MHVQDKAATSRVQWLNRRHIYRVHVCSLSLLQYGIKKKEEKEAEAAAAMEQASEGSLTRPKKAVPTGCGDEEEEEESIVDTVMKFIPTPLMDMFNKK